MGALRIGGVVDPATGSRTSEDVVLPSADLTTHAVIVGMTGSGKTGLGIVLVEECLSSGVPVLLIDPKGDLTNLCLTFPTMTGADLEPWVNDSDVAKSGGVRSAFAEQQAATWRQGLDGWGVPLERIGALRREVEFDVYTPGSSTGTPLNVVGSLRAPAPGANPEDTADEIESYVSSLLALVGVDADPLASREHVLLSSLIAAAWANGRDLDLSTLLAQVQTPPMRKLGVLEIDQFFPSADRSALAVRLNSLLASPSFAAWTLGDPVDIDAMLRTPDGRPRCAIVTTSHLSDEQRQSVTALILSKLVTWTRRQGGTSDLRALLYMDEVAGYLPPTATPPSKKPILLLLKQARAFGVGVVLSTQNPVDIDYKALSNAGTWLIGRLQTEQDKRRLVDGLASASGSVDVGALEDTISGLAARQFVLRRVGSHPPVLTTSRWAMSYLRGPLVRDEISRLAEAGLAAGPSTGRSATADASQARTDTAQPTPPPLPDDATPVAPGVAPGVPVSYLDPAAAWSGAVGAVPGGRLAAAVVARVRLRYDDAAADLVHDQEYEAVLYPLAAQPDPMDLIAVDYDERDLLAGPPATAVYTLTDADIAAKSWWTSLSRAITDHLARTLAVEILVNPGLRLFSRVDESPEAFAVRCTQAAGDQADAAIAALRRKYETKLRTMRSRAESAADASARSAARHEAEHGAAVQVATLLGGVFGGRRSRSSIITEAKRASASAARVGAAEQKARDASLAISDIERELVEEIAELDGAATEKAQAIETRRVPLERSDVKVADLRLVWIPAG